MTQQLIEATKPVDAIKQGPTSPSRSDWQRVSLLVGGVAFSAGNLLHPLEHTDAAYQSATWEAAHLVIFFSLPLLVLGLPVLHRALVPRVGSRLSTIAVAASVVGLIGIGPGTIIETFVAPMIGHDAMTELESGGMAAVNGLFGSAYLGGTIALGWAIYRARLRPRWTGPVLIVGAVVLMGMMTATGPAAGVVIITATVAYGLSLSALAWTLRPSRRTAGTQ